MTLKRNFSLAITLLIAIGVTAVAYLQLTSQPLIKEYVSDSNAEAMYLPDGHGLEIISFGYRNLLADILWFNTINYFGKHFKGDRNYRWLYHMCKLVTKLDPDAEHAFKFCATMLSWEANRPELAINLLNKAIQHDPTRWPYYYLRGFTNMFFIEDIEAARKDFAAAAKHPDAPREFLKELTAKLGKKDPRTRVQVLQNLLNRAEDPNEKRALTEKLKDAIDKLNLQNLNRAIAIYKNRSGKAPSALKDLVTSGILDKIPRASENHKFVLNPQGDIVLLKKTNAQEVEQ
ncbi:MAG: hypothetical protein D6719_04590 [Candidatus Dadabacteria bacterium]|nr:MAG: hypothetical protein D6719_04590 [Candidatus Dadabacteria bacterium]